MSLIKGYRENVRTITVTDQTFFRVFSGDEFAALALNSGILRRIWPVSVLLSWVMEVTDCRLGAIFEWKLALL